MQRVFTRVLPLCLFLVPCLRADNIAWDGEAATDAWHDPTNWESDTLPTAIDQAWIGVHPSDNGLIVGTGMVSQSGAVCDYLYLGRRSGTPMRSGELRVQGGDLTVGTTLYCGYTGTGLVTQTAGNVDVQGTLSIGELVPGGTYRMHGGGLSIGTLWVGRGGPGWFTQTGGVVEATDIQVGVLRSGASSGGTFQLSGGVVTGADWSVGYDAEGLLVQSGGVSVATISYHVGDAAGSTGTLRLDDGLCDARVFRVGSSPGATGTCEQTGGTLMATNQGAYVASYGRGTLRLSGGQMESKVLQIGYYDGARGEVVQSGGTNTSGQNIILGNQPGSTGIYTLVGGEIRLGINKQFRVGAGGHGELYIGNSNGAGQFVEYGSPANLWVADLAGSSCGLVQGWGSIGLSGVVFNNGRVIADGYGTDRALDLSSFSGIRSNVWLSVADAGWYARNHGRLRLPDISVGAGSSTVYWGEVDNLDLVNGVRLDLTGAAAGTLTGALLATDHGAVSNDLHKPVTVWDFSGITFSACDLTIHYDTNGAAAMNVLENELLVLQHDGTGWVNITDTVSPGADTITASAFSPISQIALATLPKGTVVLVR